MVFKIDICKCKEPKEVFDERVVEISTRQGPIKIPSKGSFGFCKSCGKAMQSKNAAKKVLSKYVHEKEEALGLMTGNQIKSIREDLNMPSAEFAAMITISPPTLSHWENYKAIPALIVDRTTKETLADLLREGKIKNHFARETIKKVLQSACYQVAI